MEFIEKKTYKLTPFGVKIKEAGLTYYRIWKDCGVPQTRLAAWARGKARPTIGRDLFAVVEYLDWHGVNIDISSDFEKIEKSKTKVVKKVKKIPVPRRKDWKGGGSEK